LKEKKEIVGNRVFARSKILEGQVRRVWDRSFPPEVYIWVFTM